jgi:hypothetical protein
MVHNSRRRSANPDGFRLRLLAGLVVTGALLLPAQALGRHATSRQPAAAGTAPKCRHVAYDNSADAPDAKGQQANQLDLVQTTLGLNKAHTKLRLVMTFKNLSRSIPSPGNYMAYELSWTNPSGDSGPNALDVSVTSSGITYSAGTQSGNVYTPSSTTSATGTFGHGPGGAIEIDAPLKGLKLKIGQVLRSPVANTYTGVASPVVDYGQGADSDSGASYKLGQPTCIDPEKHRA